MAVVFQIDGQTLRCEADIIAIGRSPSNQISLPNDVRLAPVQAVMKSVAGRWIIEAREGGPIRVGDGRPTQFAWLNPGDVIHLTESGPQITFTPDNAGAAAPQPVVSAPRPTMPQRAAEPCVATPPREVRDHSDGPVKSSIPQWLLYAGGGGMAAAILIGMGMFLNGRSHAAPDSPASQVVPGESSVAIATPSAPGVRAVAPVPKIPAVDARQALYSLELRTADRTRTVQLGTAWAVAPRRLVTTGDAARGVALNQEFFPHAYARHTLTGTEYEITRMTLHPQYESAIVKADQAIREINRLLPELEKIKDANDRKEAEDLLRKLDSQAIVAAEESINVNIAILDISQDSPASLSWDQSLPIKVGQQMTLIGHALSRTDALVDPDHPKLLEQHVGRLQHAEPVQNPAVPARCLVKFDGIQKDQNWSGSPVLSANGAVIGVYVRPTPPPPGVDTIPITTHDVTVINGVGDWLPKTIQATAKAQTL